MCALKSPVRVALVHALVRAGARGTTAAALRCDLRLHAQALALHLRSLQRSGLIAGINEQGVFVYRLEMEAIDALADALGAAPHEMWHMESARPTTPAELINHTAAAFGALSKPHRLRVFLYLASAGARGLPLSELAARTGLSAGTVARTHLVLQWEGLIVDCESAGGRRCAICPSVLRSHFDTLIGPL